MDLVALHKRVVGLDIHQSQITACALIEQSDGTTRIKHRQFGGFKRNRRELADWVAGLQPDCVVMQNEAVERLKDGSITDYRYDPAVATLVKLSE